MKPLSKAPTFDSYEISINIYSSLQFHVLYLLNIDLIQLCGSKQFSSRLNWRCSKFKTIKALIKYQVNFASLSWWLNLWLETIVFLWQVSCSTSCYLKLFFQNFWPFYPKSGDFHQARIFNTLQTYISINLDFQYYLVFLQPALWTFSSTFWSLCW